MKKRIKYFFVAFILLVIPFINVLALSVSKNDLTIEKGGNNEIELYANTESEIISVSFTLVYSTYDIPANFTPADGFNDTNPNSINHEIIFDKAKTGKILLGTIKINVKMEPKVSAGTVNLHTAKAKTKDGDTINLNNQSINVKVGTPVEEPKEEPKSALLTKIESKIVNIELKENTYEYTVDIDSKVEELDLKGIAEDSDATVEITSQKIKELKDNKIIITVKNGDAEKKYTINVIIKEDKKVKKDNEITIDNSKFEENKNYKGKWIVISIILIIILMVSLVLSRKK